MYKHARGFRNSPKFGESSGENSGKISCRIELAAPYNYGKVRKFLSKKISRVDHIDEIELVYYAAHESDFLKVFRVLMSEGYFSVPVKTSCKFRPIYKSKMRKMQ